MPKPTSHITTTLGPIHFEDLEPHRFEDLIRQLIYDFRDWQTIEATGRSGSDEGFDIRAYEKSLPIAEPPAEDGDEPAEPHPMEGNRWMIQGKREKEIGPTKLRSILRDVDATDAPYGYILAASVNFSKKVYDVFREELRQKGVQEFHLWGKGELEDALLQPKNDRILFTFFGMSLVSRRRSRATDVRSTITVKNKLFRAVGEGQDMYQSVLVRDLNDTHYPFKSEYPNFEKQPAWREYIAYRHEPIGLVMHVHEYFAYVDHDKKEWDYSEVVDLLNRQVEDDDERTDRFESRQLVEATWQCFPRANQAHFEIDALLRYADIAIVDDKGDSLYKFPQLYVDKAGKDSWFAHGFPRLVRGNEKEWLTDEYKRVSVFPQTFIKPKLGRICADMPVSLDDDSFEAFRHHRLHALFETDGRYQFLTARDLVPIMNADKQGASHVQVTHKEATPAKQYLDRQPDEFAARMSMKHQLNRNPADDEVVNIYEIVPVYNHQLEEPIS